MKRAFWAVLIASTALLGLNPPTEASGTSPPTARQVQKHRNNAIRTGHIIIRQRDGAGKTRVVRRISGRAPRAARTWEGFYGTSKETGCRTAGIAQEGTTLLGFHAFWYITSTHWCWNRSRHSISNVYNVWDFSANSTFKWRGEPQKPKTTYYSWLSGQTRSGYYHWRKGSFENCWYFCGGEWYPVNAIRVHSNGTYWVQGSGL